LNLDFGKILQSDYDGNFKNMRLRSCHWNWILRINT